MDAAAVVLAQWPGHMWGWGSGWTWLFMALFWAVVVGLAVYVARSSSSGHGSARSARSARDILAERFAAGDIDADEYRERLHVLDEHAGGGRRD